MSVTDRGRIGRYELQKKSGEMSVTNRVSIMSVRNRGRIGLYECHR